jgi:hypothetical protein
MGCDIHFYTERYTTDSNYEGPKDLSEERETKLNVVLEDNNLEPKWVSADKWTKGKYDEGEWEADELYGDRNYHLFGVLADVRGSGDCISEPRGIPDDISSGYKYIIDRWDGDGHSHSYFTLSELLEVDWEKYDAEYFTETIEKMKLIDPDPDNVRCVFFFDN